MKSKTAEVTVNENVVVRDAPDAVPVTVIGKVPTGVELPVLTETIDVHVGRQLGDEKAAVAPAGRPEAENETVCGDPAEGLAVTEFRAVVP